MERIDEKIVVNCGKTASLDVDAQKGFTPICPNELPVEGGDKIVEECNKNASKCCFRYMSKDAHPSTGVWVANSENSQFSKVEGYKNVDIRWNEHCTVGTEGFELLDGLPHPSEYNFIVYKGAERDMHPYSPVYHDLKKKISTGIIEKANRDGVETFLLGGLALDYCLGEAAFDLKKAGFRVIINLAATRAIGDANAFIEKAKKERIEFINSADELNDLPF
jgi:nicotinamidase/pyrazinamidase